MINNYELLQYLDKVLDVNGYTDYCPNGLQIEGVTEIKHITLGVSLSDQLIERAINNNSQAILVHHGIFWNKDTYDITGIKKKRIEKIIKYGINLYAYHLPLDNHPTFGNNAWLGKIIGIQKLGTTGYQNLIWYGELEQATSIAQLKIDIKSKLLRTPLVYANSDNKLIKKIAWCTGGASDFFNHVLNMDIDLYITGEAAEPTMALACESGIAYMAAGHYATERYGVQALGEELNKKFEICFKYEELNNPV